MPFSLVLPPAEPVARVVLTGVATGADLDGATRTLYAHPAWAPGADVVCDLTPSRGLVLAPGDLQALTALDADFADVAAGGCDAVVAARALDLELARLFQRLSVSAGAVRRVEVCRSLEEAYAALGVAV